MSAPRPSLLHHFSSQELEPEGGLPAESPYIGKARHKRNPLIPETMEPDEQLGLTDTDGPGGGSPDPTGYCHAQVQGTGGGASRLDYHN